MAAPAMMSRARDERLWLRTNSAFSLTRTVLGPASSCSTIGMARSGSLFISPRSASSFSSSLAWPSGETGLPGRLADLDVERLRVLGPAALREAFAHIGQRRERIGALIELPLRIGLPVERGVRPCAVRRGGNAIERLDRALVAAGIDQLTGLFIHVAGVARSLNPRGPRRRPGLGAGWYAKPTSKRSSSNGSGGGSGGNAASGGKGVGGTGGTTTANGHRSQGGSRAACRLGRHHVPREDERADEHTGKHSGHIVFLGNGDVELALAHLFGEHAHPEEQGRGVEPQANLFEILRRQGRRAVDDFEQITFELVEDRRHRFVTGGSGRIAIEPVRRNQIRRPLLL